jgi:DhnA family fructose-bisphosphate aldolase class Ia
MDSTGKTLRFGNLTGDDGKAVVVAMDHGVHAGPMDGIRNLEATVGSIVDAGADGVILNPGGVRRVADRLAGDVGVAVRVDGSGTVTADEGARPYAAVDVERALALGADAVVAMGYLESGIEADSLSLLGDLANDCSRHELPLIAEMLPTERAGEPEAVELAARVGAELGADLVKTHYTGDHASFRRIAEATPVGVVVLGGSKRESTRAVLADIEAAVEAGAVGVAMGRNVWGVEDPAGMVAALRAIVHDDASVDAALEHLA